MIFSIDKEFNVVPIYETSEYRLMDHHLKNGFCAITGFRNDKTVSENRRRNNKLKSEIKQLGYGIIPVVGGFMEEIFPDNINWIDPESEEAKNPPNNLHIIEDKGSVREFLQVLEESFIVPCFNVITKKPLNDDELKEFDKQMMDLGREYNQDAILLVPPQGKGSAHFVITKEDGFGETESTFSEYSLAKATDLYFTMKEKTLNKASSKRKQGVYGTKFYNKESFERKTGNVFYVESFVKAPCFSISQIRLEHRDLEIPVFGSHSYANSYIVFDGQKKEVQFKNETIQNRWNNVIAELIS